MSLIKNFKVFSILFVTAGMLMLTGCKKDNEKAPQITRLRAITPAPNDSVLTKAGPGQTIVIQGQYLGTAKEIYFNGYPAPFNAALFSDQNLTVTIPADMPFASLDTSKLNTVRVVTAFGEVTYKFPIVPPPPVITSMSNEMAVAGDHVTINGNNFFFVDKVIFPGNIQVSSGLTANSSGTTLDLTVPPGITQGGTIQVVNRYGIGTSLLLFNDATTGVLCNFDNVNTLNNWAGATISNDAVAFPSNRGNYARLTYSNIIAGDWVWYCCGRSLNDEVSLPWVPVANLGDPAANWALKFEINTKVPWKNGTILLDKDYGWNYQGRFEPWNTGGTPTDYKSDGWKTIVVPLSEFKQGNGTTTPAPNLTALLGASGKGGFNLYVINAGTTTVASFDVAFDNFRVARIK
ncbi:MAG: glycan-binding surface protein [Bacteroidota bacterium]|nr:glycan-binding surface protein [Bacteroidota bacterium]